MSKRLLVGSIVLILSLSSCITISNGSGKGARISNELISPVSVSIEDAVFDEDDLPVVQSAGGKLLCYFDRMENKSFPEIPAIKVLSPQKEHLYTMMPASSSSGGVIAVKSPDGRTAKISQNVTMKGFKISLTNTVNYFGLPYEMNNYIKASFSGIESSVEIRFDGRQVVLQQASASFSQGASMEFLMEESYLSENPIDAAVWVLIARLTEEMSDQNNNSNPHSSGGFGGNSFGGNQSSFNTDGSFNNNGNRFDSF